MRKLVAALSVLAISAGPVLAQGTYPCGPALEIKAIDGDGSGFSFKTGNPSGPSDWFGVDFDNTLNSCTLIALCVSLSDIGNPNKDANIGRIGIYPDNLFVDTTGATPDVGNPIAECPSAPANGAGCATPFYFLVPVTHLGDQNVHISYNHSPGDSALFVCSDGSSPPSGKSNLTTTSYTTPATALGVDWKIRAGVVPSALGGASFLINGATSSTVQQLDSVGLTFQGPAGSFGALMAFALCTPTGVPVLVIEPILIIGIGGYLPDQTTICATLACTVPAITANFCTVYLDPTDTKPNGKPKLKSSNAATLVIQANPSACGFCYGQQDDGAVGASAWSTTKPAGSTDWFNVKHGTPSPASGVSTLTGVQVANVVSNAACGGIVGNPSGGYQEVGIYAADLVQDSTGNTPNVAAAVSSVGPAVVPNGQLDWAYPATFYDTPDVAASGTVIYHAGVNWGTGDTCIFVTGDDSSAAGPDPCGTIPSSTSFSSSDGYATNAVNFSQVNWLMKVNWK